MHLLIFSSWRQLRMNGRSLQVISTTDGIFLNVLALLMTSMLLYNNQETLNLSITITEVLSVDLIVLVDAKYCFTWISVGWQGRVSDGDIFKNTSFYKKIEDASLQLPKDESLPGCTSTTLFISVAGDAFDLGPHLMKPLSTDMSKGLIKWIFNYRLSRARRIVEMLSVC